MIIIENTYGNDSKNLRAHFQHVTKKYNKVYLLEIDCFEVFSNAFVPLISAIQNICLLLHTAWCSCISGVSLVTINESLIAYQLSKAVKAVAKKKKKIFQWLICQENLILMVF